MGTKHKEKKSIRVLYIIVWTTAALFCMQDGLVAQTKTWAHRYSSQYSDYVYDSKETLDGGYILAGKTFMYEWNCNVEDDLIVIKLYSDGNVEWQKAYYYVNSAEARAIELTADGGYIIAGSSYGANIWILKLASDGEIEWEKEYSGTEWDSAYSIKQTGDGGYIVAGHTNSISGDFNHDGLVMKLDVTGNVVWQKTYGGLNDDFFYAIDTTNEGGYIAAGTTYSFGSGNIDAWALKLDNHGQILWEKVIGGTNSDEIHSVKKISSGNYIVSGWTNSFGAGGLDAWIIELDINGIILMQ